MKNYKKHIAISLCITLLVVISCSILPSKQTKNVSSWENFYPAYEVFEKVEMDKTTIIKLQQLGFDPFEPSNVAIENYLNVHNRFDPNNFGINIPKSVEEYLAIQEECNAYVATIGHVNEDRIGNAFLDVTGFHRETQVLG